MASEGKLKPRVYKEYALDDWRGAFDSLADRQVIGKSVITP
jgi:NADPH2:quinone reductase